MGSAHCVDEVLEHCYACGAFEEAPRIPIAGTSAALASNEKLRAALLFLAGAIALHAADVSSRCSGAYSSLDPGALKKLECAAGRFPQLANWNFRRAEMHSNGWGRINEFEWIRNAFECEQMASERLRMGYCN